MLHGKALFTAVEEYDDDDDNVDVTDHIEPTSVLMFYKLSSYSVIPQCMKLYKR